MKCAVVGTGFGGVHVAWLNDLPGVDVTSLIYRTDRSRAASLQAVHNIPNVFECISDALQAGPLDFISIASPPETHVECVRSAIAFGVPIVLDKPLAQNLEEAEIIHALARTQDTPIFVFFQWRLHPAAQKLKVLLDQNALGVVTHVDATFDHDFLAGNETNWPWRHQETSAGAGSLSDMGVHLFDLVRFVTGQEWTVVGALIGVAHLRRRAGARIIECAADDFAQVSLRASSSPLTARVTTSRISMGHRSIAIRVYGEDGVAAVTFDPETGAASLLVQTVNDTCTQDIESSNPYEMILESLSGQSRNGTMPACTSDGLAAQKLMAAAVLAAKPAYLTKN